MKKTLIAIGMMCIIVYACTHETTSPGSTGTTNSTPVPITPSPTNDTVCFQSEVLPLYQSYCSSTGCHDATTAKEGVILTDYLHIMNGVQANNPGGSKNFTVIGKSMPPAGSPQLTTPQIATIQKWINQGALSTTCTASTCDTTKITYTNGVSQLFVTYCNGCHGTSPGSGNVVLSDYASAKAAGVNLKTNFLNAINYTAATASKNMPPAGKLSSCQIIQITKWINNGCPQ